MFVSRGTWSSE